MPKVLPAQENQIRRIIRDTVAIDPYVTVTRLMNVIEKKTNRGISHEYVTKLLHKVSKETVAEIDHTTLAENLAQMSETFRIASEKLLQIAFWQPDKANPGAFGPSYKDQIAALRTLAMLQKTMLEAKMDAGIFTRHIGVIEEQRRYVPIQGDERAQILRAFELWGVKPPKVFEQAPDQPIKPKVINLPLRKNADPKNTAGPVLG